MADSRLQAYSDVLPLLHALPRIEAENGHGPGTLKASAGPSLTCSGVDCELSFLHGLTHIKNKVLLCKKHKAAHHCDHHCTVAHLPPLSLSFSFSLSLSFSLFLFLSFSFSLSLSLSLSLSDASLGLTPANAMTAPLASSLSVLLIFLRAVAPTTVQEGGPIHRFCRCCCCCCCWWWWCCCWWCCCCFWGFIIVFAFRLPRHPA